MQYECALFRVPGAGELDKGNETRRALDRFLSGVEQSAFRMARAATGNVDDALDIVQDTMMRLVNSYADREESEWRLLFFRILSNRIRDHYRRNAVRNRVIGFFSGSDEDNEYDPIASAPDVTATPVPEQVRQRNAIAALESAVEGLSGRQRQAFLLRRAEGFSVADTAKIMGVTQGSVKTHYSRAVSALRDKLQDHIG